MTKRAARSTGRTNTVPARRTRAVRATPGHSVEGTDVKRQLMAAAESIYQRALNGEQRLKEQDAQWKYAEQESITALVRKVRPRRQRARFKATTVTEVGGTGHGVVWAEAFTFDDLEAELRWALAQHYTARNLTRDYDEARERAGKVALHFDRSFALGSKGELS